MRDDPNTRDQAEALLNDYYQKEKLSAEAKQEKSQLPAKPNLLSWDLKDDGTMVVVDGASGRKLEFEPQKPKGKKLPEVPAPQSARRSQSKS